MIMSKWGERLTLLGILAVAALFLGLFAFSETVQEAALWVLEWFERQGARGLVLYICMYIVIVLLLVPAVIFTLGAGFVFGFWKGLLVVLVAMGISAPMAFLLARYALGERVAEKLKHLPRLRSLNKGFGKEGWKIVLLSRLIPGFPFKLSNYFFGLTEITLRGFFIGTMVGMLPFTIVNVYVGSLASRLTDLVERDREPWEWTLYGAGLVAGLVLVSYIVRLARREMERALEPEE